MYKEYLTQITNEYIVQVEILGAEEMFDIKKCMDSFAIEVVNITKTQQFIFFRNDEIKVI